jgi:hypothetical protein
MVLNYIYYAHIRIINTQTFFNPLYTQNTHINIGRVSCKYSKVSVYWII